MLSTTANLLAGLVGAFGLFLGLNALRSPAAATGFGIPGTPTTDRTFQAWLTVKAVRDMATGLFIFIVLAAATPRLLGWFLLAAALIPVGDALIVLRSNGPRATAYGVHGGTAVAIAAIGVLVLLAG